jgi:hypothetical protein
MKRVQLLQLIYPIGIEEKVKYSVLFEHSTNSSGQADSSNP